MENITASVEEVTLSETTSEEQRKSTSCMRFTDNDAAIIYFNYMKSKPKNALSIVRVIHPGSRVTTDYSRITNNHTNSAPYYSGITNNHTTSASIETGTPTKEFKDTPGKGDQGLFFSPPAVLPELSPRRTLDFEVQKVREGKQYPLAGRNCASKTRRGMLRRSIKSGST